MASTPLPVGLMEQRLTFLGLGRKPQSFVLHWLPGELPAGESPHVLFNTLFQYWSNDDTVGVPLYRLIGGGGVDVFSVARLVLAAVAPSVKQGVTILTWALASGDNGGPCPAGSTLAVTLETDGTYRRGNGRIYLPGIPAAQIDQERDRVTTDYRDDVNECFQSLQPYLAALWPSFLAPQWVVWNKSHQTGGVTGVPATSVVERPVVRDRFVDTIRRRQAGNRQHGPCVPRGV